MRENGRYYLNGKRYYTMAQYCQERYGSRIVKIPLSSGMTCPNRDGTKGTGGCTFCTLVGDGPSTSTPPSLRVQYEEGLRLTNKWGNARPVAYFQSFSNTYAPVGRVEELLCETLKLDGLAGIRLATRADCLDSPMVDLLAYYANKTTLEIEIGLQTVFDQTAQAVNRCHTFEAFSEGYLRLKNKNIYTCVHLINGLPQETTEMMLQTAKVLATLRPNGIKLHMLHLLEGTPLAQTYAKSPFTLLSQGAYVDVVCQQLRHFAPDTVIERLTGDGEKNALIAPLWTLNKRKVLNAIDMSLARQNIWQGDCWEEKA